MSSPLSSLRKSKKAPLPTRSRVPFRHNGGGPTSEGDLFDSATRREVIAGIHRERRLDGGGSQPPLLGAKAPTDAQLLSSMTNRLSLVEKELLASKKEIVEKDNRIRELEGRLSAVEVRPPGQAEVLEKRCQLLQRQVDEMEEFLNDYGMVWVGGGRREEEEAGGCVWRPGDSLANTDIPFTVDYDLIIKNVKELNVLAGEGSIEVAKSPLGGRLQPVQTIPLTLYENGIVMFQGPFRPFSDPQTQQCMLDLMDGYFPSELHAKYPEGVPLQVTDKREHTFQARCYGDIFPGSGNSLGGMKGPSKLLMSSWQQQRGKVTSELPGPKVSAEKFLSQLPVSVVRRGKVMDIRSGIAETLHGEKMSDVKLVDTPTLHELRSRLDLNESDRPPTPGHVTTLRVRSEQGQQMYILKMKYTDSIGDVERHLRTIRPTDAATDYVLKSTFPPRTYTDESASLVDCGLVPSANLILSLRHQ